MLTKEKIKIFAYYKGDVDGFGHGNPSHRKQMDGSEFYLINNLLSDLHMITKNLVSKEYILTTEIKLKESCEDESTIAELKRLPLFGNEST